MSADQILTALSFVGLGALLKGILDFFIGIRKNKLATQHEFKEKRYKAVLLLSFALINYEKEKIMIIINRPDINSLDKLSNELHTEWVNMALYASDNVIIKMKSFLEQKDNDAYFDFILAMRKDLYGIKTKLMKSSFELIHKKI